MPKPDPKYFYNEEAPHKLGSDYEFARWRSSALLVEQHRMMVNVLSQVVAPCMRGASRVLELGPGPGTWTKFLLKANPTATYTLVDISHKMLSLARTSLAPTGKEIGFVESDFLEFQVSQSYDFFFSSRAIEYIEDKTAAVKKIATLLAPGASGVIITKMPKPLFDRIRGRTRALHGAQVFPQTLVDMLEQTGLIVDSVRLATATVPVLGSARANFWAYRLFKNLTFILPVKLFAESYLVVFRKPA